MYTFAEYLFWIYDLDNYSVRYLETKEIQELRDEYEDYIQEISSQNNADKSESKLAKNGIIYSATAS